LVLVDVEVEIGRGVTLLLVLQITRTGMGLRGLFRVVR
jgi:hypothetical protein